ncbi:hypothetical protein CWE15_10280 [Aliidiomarina taiwanensis]|uniref:Uncharacterized protein n=1 Tax=Aliidiomarina taiwanensis TaxID=946228 RepID=A0A432WYL4_9GAMM|nr:hypothetical protein [Aliidiomarina taiwanensis]RUO38884.1 hypothetical protein CWE15_10280 [Aliidiomarina taiwanensis]
MAQGIDIKYNFSSGHQSPAEVFEVMAGYIRVYTKLGNVLSAALGESEELIYELEKVKVGSLIGQIAAKAKGAQSYVVDAVRKSSDRTFANLVENISNREQVEKLVEEAEKELNDAAVGFVDGHYPVISREAFAEVLAELSSVNERVVESESVEFINRDASDKTLRLNTDWRFNANVKEMFLAEGHFVRQKMYLTVKIAVNEGDSVWTFRDNKTKSVFKAKVVHEEWLKKYQNSEFSGIGAKDVMVALVEMEYCDGGDGIFSDIKNAKIVHVYEIVRHKLNQGGFDEF